MNETLAYTILKTGDGWEAKSDAWPHLLGTGRTEHLAIDDLKKTIQDAQPSVIGLYETSNIGSQVNLRGVCFDEYFAQDWVAENNPQKTWESRYFSRIPLLGPSSQ